MHKTSNFTYTNKKIRKVIKSLLASVRLQSKKKGELNKFLSKFYNTDINIENELKWDHKYQNPIEMSELIGVFVDNIENYKIKMWIHLDPDIYIKISDKNANSVIRYLFERYPY